MIARLIIVLDCRVHDAVLLSLVPLFHVARFFGCAGAFERWLQSRDLRPPWHHLDGCLILFFVRLSVGVKLYSLRICKAWHFLRLSCL